MATNSSESKRYNLPVEAFLERVLAENYPDRNVREGSVYHDVFIRPASLLLQPFRDYLKVLARNQSVQNFQVMDENELDALAANFLVERRDGVRARGTQRVFFRNLQPVFIGPEARFFDERGQTYTVVNPITLTETQLEANVYAPTGEYFVDVAVVATAVGEDGMAAAGTVRTVRGIQGATRTINNSTFVSGKNRDSNTELYQRILGSITNRDLVKKNAIEKAVLDNFETVRAVQVVGFGDAAMDRDTANVVLATNELFRVSYATKANVPLDGEGNISFTDAAGNVIQTPVGGTVGAIVDNLDLDYKDLNVTLDGRTFERISIQPGFRVRLYGENDSDPDIGDYTIRRVIEGPIEAGGEDKRLLLLDRPLSLVSTPAEATDRFPYTIIGNTSTHLFHIGGKVDVYVDTTGSVEKTVTISNLTTASDGTAEVPLTKNATSLNGDSLFENGIGFDSPVLNILKIEELDPASDNFVLRTLVPDVHYVVIRAEKRGRFSLVSNDSVIIRGQDTSGSTPVPLFEGSRLRFTYTTNPDIPAIQQFVNTDTRRDVTKDILVKAPETVILDVNFDYRGTASLTDVKTIVSEFIQEKSFEPTVTVNEIVSVLAFFGVTDIVMPMTLTSRFDRGDGEIDVETSEDRLSAGVSQIFVPAADLNIRKIG